MVTPKERREQLRVRWNRLSSHARSDVIGILRSALLYHHGETLEQLMLIEDEHLRAQWEHLADAIIIAKDLATLELEAGD